MAKTYHHETGQGIHGACSDPTGAWSVFACPVTQVMKFRESVEELAPGNAVTGILRYQTRSQAARKALEDSSLRLTVYDPMAGKQLHLGFVFSKNGVPSFECFQPFDTQPSARGHPSMGEILTPGLCAGCKADSRSRPRPRDYFHEAWRDIQDAMARFGCVTEMRALPGTNWVEVGPSVSIVGPEKTATLKKSAQKVSSRTVLRTRTVNKALSSRGKAKVRAKGEDKCHAL
ncbi:hypothetical protein LIA77_04050 [Sarocladium implicatum]|nr:hypothetical protein LIA77_04050 [Sarocladium implicatum]